VTLNVPVWVTVLNMTVWVITLLESLQ